MSGLGTGFTTRSAATRRRRGARSRLLGQMLIVGVASLLLLGAAPVSRVAYVPYLPTIDTASAASSASSPFVSNRTMKTWYRIPAVITTAEGHVLAFAERRDNDKTDMGNFDVVMRTSVDGGRTWGPLRTVANDGKNRVSNPVPVLDPRTGDVLLITSIRNSNDTYKGIYAQRSTDGGNTFTPLLDSRIKVSGSWKGGLTGPGHGIVLKRGPHVGRILVAMGYKKANYYGAYGILSDDGGRTWRTGYDQADTSGRTAYIEGTISEMPDGELHINYRDKHATTPGRTRLYALSSDGGASLSTGFKRQASLKIHSVEGSVLNPAGTYGGAMLFSAPLHTSARDRTLRRDMGVFVSWDGGHSWGKPYPVELESKPAAYSDMVQLDDATIGVMYETGKAKWRERIVFRRIAIAQVLSPTKVPSAAKGSLRSSRITRTHRAAVRTTVTVQGIGSPPGKVLVKYKGAKKSGTAVATLTYSNRGKRSIILPRLPKGTYRLSVVYSGNARVKSKTVSAGILNVR